MNLVHPAMIIMPTFAHFKQKAGVSTAPIGDAGAATPGEAHDPTHALPEEEILGDIHHPQLCATVTLRAVGEAVVPGGRALARPGTFWPWRLIRIR